MNIDVPVVITRTTEPADLPAIVALQSRAFSPGRFARTAYRVREGTPDLSPFCRVAYKGERLIAALRLTEINVGGRVGALFLGPLAVDPDEAGRGYARRLVSEALEAARHAGIEIVILVGDMGYYGRLGFAPVALGQITLPGPVDLARILAAELAPGARAMFRGQVASRS